MLELSMKKTVGILTLLGVLLNLQADDSDRTGAYIGASVGRTAYVDSGFAKNEIVGVDEEVSASALGGKILAGYLMNRIIGLEAAYVYYGNFEINENYAYKAQAVSLSANVGYTFVSTGLRAYTLVGLGYVYSSFTQQESVDVSAFNPTLHLGFGVDYLPVYLNGMGIRAAYESNSFIYGLHNNTPQEKQYAQGFGMLYLGLGYKF